MFCSNSLTVLIYKFLFILFKILAEFRRMHGSDCVDLLQKGLTSYAKALISCYQSKKSKTDDVADLLKEGE